MSPFLPLYLIQLGVHPIARVDVWSGLLSSCSPLIAAFTSPIWGSMADRFGRKAMVLRSSIAISIFTLLMGLSQNVWELFILRTAMGMFSGFSASAIALVATQVEDKRLGYALGWLSTGQLVGSLIGPLFGGALQIGLATTASFFLDLRHLCHRRFHHRVYRQRKPKQILAKFPPKQRPDLETTRTTSLHSRTRRHVCRAPAGAICNAGGTTCGHVVCARHGRQHGLFGNLSWICFFCDRDWRFDCISIFGEAQ
ncbi:MFS transporter [Alicyclobacillus fodiniaquatilis]|uniref:MFS transporter n=1 Tax=Alicyclobacillus fodiniaquatilis TaxID=1661150 RepID=A0ABW4JH83_9BACL